MDQYQAACYTQFTMRNYIVQLANINYIVSYIFGGYADRQLLERKSEFFCCIQ